MLNMILYVCTLNVWRHIRKLLSHWRVKVGKGVSKFWEVHHAINEYQLRFGLQLSPKPVY